MRMRSWITATLLALAPVTGQSQNRDSLATLEGRVLDATDSGAVSYAEVRLTGRRALRSDGHGRFKFVDVPPGEAELFVRSLGYAPLRIVDTLRSAATVARDIYLIRVPRMLTQMVVKGRSMRVPSGFETIYQRGGNGLGTFLTREQIDSMNPRDVAALLASVPFVHIDPWTDFTLSTHRCGNVGVWLNGMPASDTAWIRNILTDMAPSSIQAIEVYDGLTRVPPQFARTPKQHRPACAVIAIWTRRG
jgi:hypothetical protein